MNDPVVPSSAIPSREDTDRHRAHWQHKRSRIDEWLGPEFAAQSTRQKMRPDGHAFPWFPAGCIARFMWEPPARRFMEALVRANFSAALDVLPLVPQLGPDGQTTRNADGVSKLGIHYYLISEPMSSTDEEILRICRIAWNQCGLAFYDTFPQFISEGGQRE